jgi:predicted metalloprotease with PDZ domain
MYPAGSGKAGADIAKDKIDKTAFVIGTGWREKVDGQLHLVISGDWQFSDDDAAKLAAEVVRNYRKDLGSVNADDILVAIAKFPVSIGIDNWEADTRGTTIVILSSDTPFKSQSIQRLHEQLRHEIFHLWVPNGVNLTGHFDWFYEGFALYQSLKLGVAVNRIRFDDYLDTLSRAYDIDRHWPGKISLIEASNQRWNGANTQVYARGLLVAFLCDLAMMEKSGRTSTDLVRELYEKHRPPAATQDGNAAVLALMRQHPELVPIVDRNITGADTIDWQSLLQGSGLATVPEGSETKLRVMPKLTGRQKDLLNRLGYNNWRKLTKSSK